MSFIVIRWLNGCHDKGARQFAKLAIIFHIGVITNVNFAKKTMIQVIQVDVSDNRCQNSDATGATKYHY